MRAQPKYQHYITEEEYLAAERQAEFKSEYFNGEVFPLHQALTTPLAMAGASDAHNVLVANLIAELGYNLRHRNCTVRASDMRLQVIEAGLYTYPDVSVVCGEPQFRPDTYLDTLLNPVVLIEVMSHSTQGFDQVGKLQFYRNLASLRHYLLVASNKVSVACYTKLEEKHWSLIDYDKLTDSIPLPALGLDLPVAEIYRKVPLPERPGRG